MFQHGHGERFKKCYEDDIYCMTNLHPTLRLHQTTQQSNNALFPWRVSLMIIPQSNGDVFCCLFSKVGKNAVAGVNIHSP